ncbi:cupin domain-containing protein [Streptomyces sp. NPDC017248]|uniref:cupin domain-containing protein n=1 Tax=unclassified Streptomyces TaxID=2593676 RepID=UPI0037B53C72
MTSPSATDTGPAAGPAPQPRVLCETRALAEEPPVPAGVLWKLAESGRQLDANVVRLAPGGRVPAHTEAHLDVLVLVVAGDGVLGDGSPDTARPLAEGALVWLPHGAVRGITAGPAGLTYVTVHTRRPGMRIGARPGTAPDRLPGPASP